jgi:hypothetical protein
MQGNRPRRAYSLDHEARRLRVTRQSLIKLWLAERWSRPFCASQLSYAITISRPTVSMKALKSPSRVINAMRRSIQL